MENLNKVIYQKTDFLIVGKSLGDRKDLAFHPINDKGQVMAEKPFSKKTAKAIFSLFKDYDFKPLSFDGFIDRTILKAVSNANSTELMFYVPMGINYLYFADGLNLKTGNYITPTLIFKLHNNTISIAATLDKTPNQNSPLFYAPFFNVFKNGAVCMGSVDIQASKHLQTFDALKQFIVNAFFNSVFTHSNHSLISESYLKSKASNKKWTVNDLFPIKMNDNKQLTLKDF